MARIKIDIKEIEKMIEEQIGAKPIEWDDDGSLVVELDLEDLKKREIIIEKYPWRYPIYTSPTVKPFGKPYYTISTTGSSGQQFLSFNGGN